MIFLTTVIEARLQKMEICIAPVRPDQFVVGAVLDDTTTLDCDDAVGPAHRGKPVSADENRAAFTYPAHVVLDDALTLVIERAGGFVEDQNAGISHQGTSDRDALPLTAREAAPSFAYDRVIAFGKFENELMRARQSGGVDNPLHGHGG